jgi:hypothetical protein
MTKWIEVKRIHVPILGPFNYPEAKAEVNDADARRRITVEGRDIVIRTPVFLRGRGRAA